MQTYVFVYILIWKAMKSQNWSDWYWSNSTSFFSLSSSNCLTFDAGSMVTPPTKISVGNVEVYWSLCLLGSTFPTRRLLRFPPICLRASWDQKLNRWLYLRHWLSYRNQKGRPSLLVLPTIQHSERRQAHEPAASKSNEGKNWTPSSHPSYTGDWKRHQIIRGSTGCWTTGF